VEKDEIDGRPKSTRNEVNIAAVANLFKNDRRIAPRMIAELAEHCSFPDFKRGFGKENLCVHFVPLSLTLEQREV